MKHLHHCFATGVVPLIGGYWMRYQVGKRRFNRPTITGAERFYSYGDSMISRMGRGSSGRSAPYWYSSERYWPWLTSPDAYRTTY